MQEKLMGGRKMKYKMGKKNALSLIMALSMGVAMPSGAFADENKANADDKIAIESSDDKIEEENGETEENAEVLDSGENNDSLVAVTAVNDDAPTSGSCSDYMSGELKWNYDRNSKTLTISGYGDMSNYCHSQWEPFCNEIENIVIGSRVWKVGENAFKDMPKLTSVQLGKDLESIEEGAFENDTALESIVIPDSVTYMPSGVFKNCSKLKKVGMSANLKYLYNSFEGTAIEVLEVPSSVETIYTNALEKISGLKVIYAGSENVAKLCKEKMPNLAYCITDGGNLKMNSTLTSTSFCEVERMGDIFDGWYVGDNKAASLESGKTYTAKWTPDPNAVVEGDCSDKDEDNVTWKYERATKTLTIGGKGKMDSYTSRWSVGPYVPYEKFKGEIEKVVVKDGIEKIGNSAFSEMPKLKYVDLGKVKELGTYVFYGDNDRKGYTGDISLESLVIPDTVTSIGRCFAYGATNLKNVQMSRNLKYLFASALSGTSVEVLELPTSVERIKDWEDYGQHAFEGAKNLKMVYAGSADVLKLCQESRLNLIYAVTNGGYLVKGQNLTSTAFGEVEKDGYVLEGWYDNALFTGKPVTEPTSNGVYYAKWAVDTSASGTCGDNLTWSYKKSTKTLTINGSGEMADYTDAENTPWKDLDIENVVMPDEITHIGDNAFNGKNIGSIVIAKDVTVGKEAFANLPEKSVIYVNDDTLFENIDNSITKERTAVCYLDGSALKDKVLTAGTFGTPAKENMAFAGWRKVLDNGELYFASAEEPVAGEKYKALFCEKSGKCGENATWSYDEESGMLTISGTGRMYDYTSEHGKNPRPWEELSLIIKKGVIEDGITYVGSYAFANMTMELKEVTLGKDIVEIGDKAFYCTRAVSNYTLPEGLTKIDSLAFSNTDSLDSIKLPSTLTEIGEQAFYAGHLYGIVVPKSVTTLADNTFELIYAYRKADDAAVPVIYLESDTLMFTRDDAAVCRLNGGKMNKTVFEPNKLAVPTRAGYIFQGWYEADENGNATETKADVPAKNKVYVAKWVESDVTASADSYRGEYDGNSHSITVNYPENAGITEVLYSTDGETYSSEKPDFTNVTNGEKTVYYRLMREGNACAEGSATVEITPCDNPVTITADKTSLRNGGTVTLTINIAEKAKDSTFAIENVICDKEGIKISENGENTYTAVIPASPAETYMFTAEVSGDWISNSKNPEVNVSVTNNVGGSSHGSSSGGSSSNYVAYTTDVSSSDNGKVTVSPANISAGGRVTLTAKPDEGYTLSSINITDKNGKEITFIKQGNSTFIFVMPSSNVDVEAVFAKIGETKKDDKTDDKVETKTIKMQIGSKDVSVDEKEIANDVAPVIVNDRTLVPIRLITETLGGEVEWDGSTKTVTLKTGGKEITMTIGKVLEKYGVAPVIINDRTFVPVRFVADELGAETAWDEATKTVTITKVMDKTK